MSWRALTLIVLMATWMVPVNGYACPPDASGVAAHGHDEVATSHSHTSGQQAHSHAGRGISPSHGHAVATTIADSPPQFSGIASHERPHELSTCCERGRDAFAVEAAVKNLEPQPKSDAAVVQAVIATVLPAACLATGAQVQRQQPPSLPYEKSRRPLLI